MVGRIIVLNSSFPLVIEINVPSIAVASCWTEGRFWT